nr:hypothetical protein [Candidatus Sigynarchaeota archaeon]
MSLIVENGEVIKERNTTRTVNGTTYTIVYREYSLEVNGTTYSAVKLQVYDSYGRLLLDPDVCVHMFPLVYWLQILWWGYWVYYGNDYYVYTHFPLEDVCWYLLDVWYDIQTSIDIVTMPFEVASIVCTLYGGVIGNAASIALSAISYIITGWIETERWYVLSESVAMIEYNKEWGFRTLEKLHHPCYNQPWWDPVPTVTYYLISKDGATGQVWPYGAAATINGWAAADMSYFYSTFIGTFGNGNWVYVGAYPPHIPYEAIDPDIASLIDAGSWWSAIESIIYLLNMLGL